MSETQRATCTESDAESNTDAALEDEAESTMTPERRLTTTSLTPSSMTKMFLTPVRLMSGTLDATVSAITSSRKNERRRNAAVVRIQALARGGLVRRALQRRRKVEAIRKRAAAERESRRFQSSFLPRAWVDAFFGREGFFSGWGHFFCLSRATRGGDARAENRPANPTRSRLADLEGRRSFPRPPSFPHGDSRDALAGSPRVEAQDAD